MGGAIVSRMIVLTGGTLYPAYASYKAVKSANVRQYVRWMMYWIIYALFITVETFTDILLSWIPFYYEIKVVFIIWLLSPYTKGAAFLYRKFVHPFLTEKEPEIDNFLIAAKQRSYATMMDYGSRGLNVATHAFVTAAVKGQVAMSEKLKSFSVNDISRLSDDTPIHSMSPLSGYNPSIQREIPRRSDDTQRRDVLTRPPLHQERRHSPDVDIQSFEVIEPENSAKLRPVLQNPDSRNTVHDGNPGYRRSENYHDSDFKDCTNMDDQHDGSYSSRGEKFDSAPPVASADDSMIPDQSGTFPRGDPSYSTLPRQRKSKKNKSEDPGSASSLRRSKRKVKQTHYHDSDDDQPLM